MKRRLDDCDNSVMMLELGKSLRRQYTNDHSVMRLQWERLHQRVVLKRCGNVTITRYQREVATRVLFSFSILVAQSKSHLFVNTNKHFNAFMFS